MGQDKAYRCRLRGRAPGAKDASAEAGCRLPAQANALSFANEVWAYDFAYDACAPASRGRMERRRVSMASSAMSACPSNGFKIGRKQWLLLLSGGSTTTWFGHIQA